MKNGIKFGTDGWRGITGFDFTDDKVRLISLGVCNYLKNRDFKKSPDGAKGKNNAGNKNKKDNKDGGNSKNALSGKKVLNTSDNDYKKRGKTAKVVIGYDTRFLSERFARSAAEVFSANGIQAYLSDGFVTSPALSGSVLDNKADLGIMITASHNPYYYNGYKIKGPFGGSATMDIISDIEEEVNNLKYLRELKNHLFVKNPGISKCPDINISDFNMRYKDNILSLVDTSNIKKRFGFPVVIDPMYGSGRGLFNQVISGLSNSKIYEIHESHNASFGGINPEPIGDNLNDAIRELKDKNCSIAFCIDGDGDRIGAIGENGNFVSPHHIFAILLHYLIKHKKLSGRIVKTVPTSSIIDRICASHGLELVTKPVGFKYIGEEILKGGVIMGGEESGGLWVNGYIPERDGILMSLLMIEVLCRENKTVNEILTEIYNSYGFFLYRRCDYDIEMEKKQKLIESLESKIPGELKAEGASEPLKIDGFKYFFEDKSWIMIRPSGTEAIVRIYAESDTLKKLDYLHELGTKIIGNAGSA